jgi:hypothetical protein
MLGIMDKGENGNPLGAPPILRTYLVQQNELVAQFENVVHFGEPDRFGESEVHLKGLHLHP